MPNILVVNKSAHDYEPAKKWLGDDGQMIFLTEGKQSHMAVDTIARAMAPAIMASKNDDFLLLTSTNTLSSVASVLFALRHDGILNLLLYKVNKDGGRYISRRLNLKQLLEVSEVKNDN